MKQLNYTLLSLLLTGTLMIFQSCQKEELTEIQEENATWDVELKKADATRTFYGPTVKVGNGVARAYVKENRNGDPVEVGLNLSVKALENLPDHHADFVLPFHPNKGKRFYDHVFIGWAPEGHEPPGVYDLPHFDVHFYITSVEDREAIGGQPGYDMMPAPEYIPQDYILLEGIVPQMGAHWADALAPELPWNGGATFTHTFIWGSYHGEFTFMEPMITRDFLLSLSEQPSVTAEVKHPVAWQRDGWYPSHYRMEWTNQPGQYTIALTGLEWKESL
ncbi:DUF5602 domain-containing protein [Mariniphaga sp.]|uniref:DUF5602 domain-containing protein n=1 Tax=Mariniphaga sp. TaxID=1954475 RepID=UPI00356930BB